MTKDYYSILAVPKDASKDQIKKAYRKLAIKFHPDTSNEENAEDRFKEIAEAYSVLSDLKKRKEYDSPAPKGFGGGFGDFFSQFDVGLEDFFPGQARRRSGKKRSSNLRYKLNLDFISAAKGKSIDVKVDRMMPCHDCVGTGKTDKTIEEVCSQCKGAGNITFVQGFFQVARPCEACTGTGAKIKNPCNTCSGRGVINDHTSITVNVPTGIETGNVICVKGWGHQNVRGSPPGDLFLEVHVGGHGQYRRKGSDIHTDVKISIPEAVLGCRREIDTIHDISKRVMIPHCSAPGDTVRIKGQGVSGGDHVVNIHVDFPKTLSKELEAAYEGVYAVMHPNE